MVSSAPVLLQECFRKVQTGISDPCHWCHPTRRRRSISWGACRN